MRYAIVCRGCGEPFVVRLGIGPAKQTRFYVICPACNLPIRGRMHGEDLDSHKTDFDADWFQGDSEPKRVVTIDPHVPCRYEATEMGPFGSAPNMTLVHLMGDDQIGGLLEYLGCGRHAAEVWWPRVRLFLRVLP